MNTFHRWARFNAIGLIGAILQISIVALVIHLVPRHYLYASAIAVEITLLHNFVWHIHYTWPDRRNHIKRWQQCLRFHLSNGSVSLLGNLALMHLLVEKVRLPPVAANLIAILCCSAINFLVGNSWVFT